MASILPAPQIQFIDQNGEPLIGGKVYTYEANTTTPKLSWKDFEKMQENTNPVILDDAGRAPIWIEGSYDIVVKDANDVLIYTSENINSFDFILRGLTATIADLNSTSTQAVNINSDYDIKETDRGKILLVNTFSTPINIQLLESGIIGDKYKIVIKKVDKSNNSVLINTHGIETIDEMLDYKLFSYNDFIEVLCDGSNWKIVASQILGVTEEYNDETTPRDIVNLDNGKLINCDDANGTITINLPSVTTLPVGFKISIKKINDSLNNVLVIPNLGEKIDDFAEITINHFNDTYTLTSGVLGWYSISQIKSQATFSSGDTKFTYKFSESGWLLMDDGTIGNDSSGADHASEILKDLYIVLYNNVADEWAPVEGGRTGDALNDFNTGSTLKLPETISRTLCNTGLDRAINVTREIGEHIGEAEHALARNEVPQHNHKFGRANRDRHEDGTVRSSGGPTSGDSHVNYMYRVAGAGTHAKTEEFITQVSEGGGTHSLMQPSSFLNVLIKI